MTNSVSIGDLNKKRDESIDTLKFILMCFVILGHCLESFRLHKAFIFGQIYQFIYLFHMPLFVFLSGYFMNKQQEQKKFYNGILFILETYLIYQLPSYIISSFHGLKNPLLLLDPTWAMWYLPSLIVWRIIVYNLPSSLCNKKLLVLSSLLFISVLGGFIEYTHFAFQRIITYFPFFIIGYYCKIDGFLYKIRCIPRWFSMLILFAALLGLFILNKPTSVILYQNNSYYSQPLSIAEGLVFRVGWYIITTVVSCAVLPLLLSIKSHRFAYYGHYTLLFYVCHVFFLAYFKVLISKFGLIGYPVVSFVVFIVIVFVLCAISRSRISRFMTNPISVLLNKKRWL